MDIKRTKVDTEVQRGLSLTEPGFNGNMLLAENLYTSEDMESLGSIFQ